MSTQHPVCPISGLSVAWLTVLSMRALPFLLEVRCTPITGVLYSLHSICVVTGTSSCLFSCCVPLPSSPNQVIRRHFFLKQKEIVAEAEKWVADASRLVGKKRLHAYGTAHVENAKRHLAAMKVELAKLKDEPVGGSAAT